jgi:cobalt/nickel transport protein
MLIGVGEALITGMVLAAVARSRPGLLNEALIPAAGRSGSLVAIGLVVTLGLAMFASPFASVWPDGLERVAEALGFSHQAVNLNPAPAPLPDYALPGVKSPALATALAGGVGTVVVFAACYLVARDLAPKSAPGTTATPAA